MQTNPIWGPIQKKIGQGFYWLLFLHRFLLLSRPQTKFGDLLFLHRFFLLLLLFLFFFSPWTCSTKFSETDAPIFTKLHRKVDPHLKRCNQVLEFSKWPPLSWKLWTYVKIFDLTCIGNCQRDFLKTWHIGNFITYICTL